MIHVTSKLSAFTLSIRNPLSPSRKKSHGARQDSQTKQAKHNMRTQPNIIITGTPGVGKTTHCETLAQNTGLKHLSINDIVKERGCHDGYDEEFKSWIVDEDKVCTPRHICYEIQLIWVAIGLDRRRGEAGWIHH
jgi:hypothetical protein